LGNKSSNFKLGKSIAYSLKDCQGQKIEFKDVLSNDIDCY